MEEKMAIQKQNSFFKKFQQNLLEGIKLVDEDMFEDIKIINNFVLLGSLYNKMVVKIEIVDKRVMHEYEDLKIYIINQNGIIDWVSMSFGEILGKKSVLFDGGLRDPYWRGEEPITMDYHKMAIKIIEYVTFFSNLKENE